VASFRVKLSDGTTTITLYEDFTNYLISQGGLSMPKPSVRTSFITNPFFDGGRLASASYENRVIKINMVVRGTTLTDLKTQVRAVQRLLNDAEKRTLLGYGSQVYLEYQWGDAANESTFFDVLRGDFEVPNTNFKFLKGFFITDAPITLVCKPFGRYTNQDITQDTLDNSQSQYDIKESFLTGDDTNHNIDGNNWEAQTFTTTSAFTAVGAAIKCWRTGTITDLTLALFETSGSKPTGSAIATGTVDVSAIPTSGSYVGWWRVIFNTPVALSNATEYALVAHIGEANPNLLYWRTDTAAGYAGGQRCFSADGGSSWTADATDDNLFAIFAAETALNYQDITTTEAYGDQPAPIYHKLEQTNATGSKKVWVAKRGGARQADDLWVEGESCDSWTDILGSKIYNTPQCDVAVSGEMYNETWWRDAVQTLANTEIARLNFDFATPPRGQFRVLVKARSYSSQAADYDHLSWGFGWSYGDKTYTPTEAKGEYYQCAALNTWEILDLGLLNIPPIAESDIALNNTFQLRIYHYATDILAADMDSKWDTDWVFLLPIDEGVVIVDSIAAADVLALDGITDPPNVFVLSAANKIEGFPTYTGAPFKLGRENTRIYVIRDDVKAVTFASDIKFQAQFLII